MSVTVCHVLAISCTSGQGIHSKLFRQTQLWLLVLEKFSVVFSFGVVDLSKMHGFSSHLRSTGKLSEDSARLKVLVSVVFCEITVFSCSG